MKTANIPDAIRKVIGFYPMQMTVGDSLITVECIRKSERVYKKAFSHEKAIEMILNGECGVFNPILLGCLVDIQDRLKEELQSGFQKKKNEDLYLVLSEEIKEETEK